MQANTLPKKAVWAEPAYLQKKIDQVLGYHVRKGICPPDTQHDVAQDLYLHLLEGRWERMCENYDASKASFDYYVSRWLHYDCLKIYNKKTYVPLGVNNSEFIYQQNGGGNMDNNDFSDDVQQLLQSALAALELDTPKFRLLLKIHVHKPLEMSDFKAYAPEVPLVKLGQLLREFEYPYSLRLNEVNLQLILPLMQQVEPRNCSLASVQRMLSRKMNKIQQWMKEHTCYDLELEALKNLLFVYL